MSLERGQRVNPNRGSGPLTKAMKQVLQRAAKQRQHRLSFSGISDNGMKSFVNSLLARHLIKPDTKAGEFVLTDKGMQAVAPTDGVYVAHVHPN